MLCANRTNWADLYPEKFPRTSKLLCKSVIAREVSAKPSAKERNFFVIIYNTGSLAWLLRSLEKRGLLYASWVWADRVVRGTTYWVCIGRLEEVSEVVLVGGWGPCASQKTKVLWLWFHVCSGFSYLNKLPLVFAKNGCFLRYVHLHGTKKGLSHVLYPGSSQALQLSDELPAFLEV